MTLKQVCVTALMGVLLMGCSSENEVAVQLDTSSEEALVRSLEEIRQSQGDEIAEQVLRDITFVIGRNFGDSGLVALYNSGDVEATLNVIDSRRNEALERVQGLTPAELREIAKPIEQDFLARRSAQAEVLLEELEAERERALLVEHLHRMIQLDEIKLTRQEDEFGFPEAVLALVVNNSSDLTIRALDLRVESWSTIDPTISGRSPIRLLFGDAPIAPQETAAAQQVLSNLSELAAAVVRGAGQGTGTQLLVVYTQEQGRIDMSARWTEEMEAERNRLRGYVGDTGPEI